MTKKIVGILTALCLTLSLLPAQAAPARDTQALEMTVDEKMRTLVAIADLMIPEEFYGDAASGAAQAVLEKDQEPARDVVCQALWAAAMLTRPTDHLSLEEARDLYSQLFTAGAFDLTPEADSPFLTVTEEGIDLHGLDGLGHGGAFIYSVEFDGSDVTVRCDQYSCEGADPLHTDVEELPENMVAWTGGLTLSMRYAPETEFGYTINSIALSPGYQAGDLSAWQDVENTEYEYSLKVPGILGVADDTPAHRVWQTADGAVTLTLDARDKESGASGFDQTYARLVAQNRAENLGLDIRREPDFSRFSVLSPGQYRLYVISDELSWDYELTLDFSPERQAEYELYAEFIRNSLIMWGISNG